MRSNNFNSIVTPAGVAKMADVKKINIHKRRAMGEKVDGMRKGGAVKMPPMKGKKSGKDC